MATEYKLSYTASEIDERLEMAGNAIPSPTTAEVGQILKVSAVDENSKPTAFEAVSETQSDWNQNDEIAVDYVKNRPFYELTPTIIDILPETTVTEFAQLDEGVYYCQIQNESSEWDGNGNVKYFYSITLDGTEYCYEEPIFIMGCPILGNGNFMLNTLPDTGETFVAWLALEQIILYLLTDTAPESITVSACEIRPNITKIPKKFLPNTSVHKDDMAEAIGAYAFYNRTDITGFTASGCSSIGVGAFSGCSELTSIRLDNISKIPKYAFKGCSKLDYITIFEYDWTEVLELESIDAFDGTPFAEGGAGGVIKVTPDLIEAYKVAPNWSTLYGYGTVTFDIND